VHIVLLGTAAGGGFPQWNCWCRGCTLARRDPAQARPRTQSSVAMSADGRRWFLLNASPDVHRQLDRFSTTSGPAHPDPGTIRHVPIEGVLLTDAELDHSLGVTLLREAGRLPLYATPAVRAILEHDSHVLPVTRAFADVPVTELPPGHPIELRCRDGAPAGVTVEAFPVPADPPRFAPQAGEAHTVGFVLRDDRSTCIFAPACGDLDDALLARFAAADVLLFDGTFWSDRELIDLGIGRRTARQMDHVPMAGAGGSLDRLAGLPCRHRVYTHINNTNPVLIETSDERARVTAAGLVVGDDGLHITV
jgi:pyrroloquinoline quinone biosynthesis protein B